MENINLDLYRTFYVVANSDSISQAAERLYISQPAVTQSIKKLEEQLGGKVFFRTNKGINLTEEGKRLYTFIEKSIEILDNAQKNFSKYVNLQEGKIRIRSGNMIEKQYIYDNIIKFMKDYPNIEVSISDWVSSISIEDLSKGNCDMVLLNLPYENPYPEKIKIHELFTKKLQLYCSKEYFLKNINKDKISIKELNGKDFILQSLNSNTGKNIKNFFDKYGIEYNNKFSSSSTEVRNYVAMNSLGIIFAIEDSIKETDLVKINLIEELPEVKLGVATLNDDIIGFATSKMLEYIKGEC